MNCVVNMQVVEQGEGVESEVTSAVLGDIRYDRLDITVYDTDGDTVDTVVTRRWWWTRTRGGCW